MPDVLTIRRATLADAPELAKLGARLFTEAYGPTHPEPTLSWYLKRSFSESAIAALISHPRMCFLIGEDAAGGAMAYAHLEQSTPPIPQAIPSTRVHEIHRFYVDARLHGRGVAQTLMARCVQEAVSEGSDMIWLQVWQEAPQAIAFYRKCGFAIAGTGEFPFGDRMDHDWIMTRSLAAAGTP